MENAYGIGVKNRYELFYDEDVDPLEIIRQQEEEKEKRKTDKSHCKDKSKPSKSVKQISPVLKKVPKETSVVSLPKPTVNLDKSRTRPFDRNAKNRIFEDVKDTEERKNVFSRNREDHHPVGSEARERDTEARRGRGGFRGRGRAHGRGGFFSNFDARPRREFDRYSGSDKGGPRSAEKRDGAGSSNWGDMKSDLKKEPETSWMDEEFDVSGEKNTESTWKGVFEENEIISSRNETLPEKNMDDLVTENMDSKENEPVPEDRTEEGVKEMTLDEWKREQEAKRAIPKYNLRKPGEGEDGNQWKKLYMLKKKAKEEDDDDDEDEEEEDIDDDDYARRGRHRQLVDIQINFNDSRRGRGRGRGVRGIGPRSSGLVGNKDIPRPERREDVPGSNAVGRSFGRGKINKSGQQSAPRVDDWNDFPSLVTV